MTVCFFQSFTAKTLHLVDFPAHDWLMGSLTLFSISPLTALGWRSMAEVSQFSLTPLNPLTPCNPCNPWFLNLFYPHFRKLFLL